MEDAPLKQRNNSWKYPFNDSSTIVLIFSNLLTIFFALVENWSLLTVMFIYWCQSIIIGIFYFFKILNLKDFSTEGLYINNRPVGPTKETKISTATFFAFHYGFFHFGYFMFLIANPFTRSKLDLQDTFFIFLAVATFFVSHLFSFLHNKEKDSKKKPNIGKIMFLPYARIIPMHLTIIFGSFLLISYGGSGMQLVIILFLLLKAVTDVIMHTVEHRDPSGYGSSNNIFEIALDKSDFSPGDTIEGKILVELERPVKAKSLKVALVGNRIIKQYSGSNSFAQIYTFHKSEVFLGGESEYSKNTYSFDIQIPSDILIKAENWKENGLVIVGDKQVQMGEKTIALQKKAKKIVEWEESMGLVRTEEKDEWNVEAILEIPRGIDIRNKVKINIS